MLKTVEFLALALTALIVVPGGAHIFALPNKIGLEQEAYFVVQGIYRGWALFGMVIVAAVAANGILAGMLKRQDQPRASGFAMIAALLIVAVLAVFFVWTYPANQATVNWTIAPTDWKTLRAQWEWSHAISAALSYSAFLCTALSVVLRR